jgi:NAD-dependent deacetylase
LFGENVPMMSLAYEIVASADILVIVGTSLVVYPAANLVEHVPNHAKIYIIDPHYPKLSESTQITHIKANAVEGMNKLIELLSKENG